MNVLVERLFALANKGGVTLGIDTVHGDLRKVSIEVEGKLMVQFYHDSTLHPDLATKIAQELGEVLAVLDSEPNL